MNEYLNVIRNNYVNFSGRARRREYWMFQLVNTIILVVLYMLSLVAVIPSMLAARSNPDVGLSPLFWVVTLLNLVYVFGVLLPSLGVTVRRLHDAGFSGWLILLSLIPGASLVVLVFTILDSKPGANKWGPNPKGVTAPTNAF